MELRVEDRNDFFKDFGQQERFLITFRRFRSGTILADSRPAALRFHRIHSPIPHPLAPVSLKRPKSAEA
jgi:hypothetical protein